MILPKPAITDIHGKQPIPLPLLPPQLANLLTANERIIMQALLSGQALTTIAWRLKRDIRTVSNQKQAAMTRLSLTSNAMLYALGSLLGPPLSTDITVRRQLLAPREQLVLKALLKGLSVTDIAYQQGRSVKTISYQKRRLMQKLGLNNDVALFALAPQQARVLLKSWSCWPKTGIESSLSS
ncbi:helix-turn-helix transcriptional regulator [Serratia proteamaculans]|uniref:helix-turn-helix transcriptional regulator n=1 Tax=Serratia proteamaculans TaxID=28151 RepID=UPI0021797CE3|nr:LuxR C-terminal-related transcriptional regulator [Serratia proteamaculans]CAI1627279.1 Capsular synthesis regulator component B [Serratia proteamaculans]